VEKERGKVCCVIKREGKKRDVNFFFFFDGIGVCWYRKEKINRECK